jgi:predicted lipoprotein with Yx(FWY)xxD motif
LNACVAASVVVSEQHYYIEEPAMNRTRTARPILSAASGVIVAALALTACASNKPKAGAAAQPTTAAAAASGATSPAASGASSAAAGGVAASIAVKTGAMGAYLTDAQGNTLYLFAADKSTDSTCYNACATYWPPLVTNGTPQVAGQAQMAMVGTTKRTDGTTEVTYAGHPLYYFKSDTAAGDAKGQGKNLSGGLWWIVAPDGKAITTTSSAAPSAKY